MRLYLLISLMLGFSLFAAPITTKGEDIGYTIEVLPWTEVNKLVPRYTKFTVLDTETGQKFRVQRRAGSNHADVQPLTKQDTAIMKKIYSGKWSWKRRSIIVIHNNKWIAASMHGMPHGGGALVNNFPGHFCIHFYGSTTHKTNDMDLSHKLMVLKAAGKLDEHLSTVGPYELIHSFIAGFKQQDKHILSLTSHQSMDWGSVYEKVENVRIGRVHILPEEDLLNELYLDVPIELDWYIEGKGRIQVRTEVHLIRFSPIEPWKVDTVHFLKENDYLK